MLKTDLTHARIDAKELKDAELLKAVAAAHKKIRTNRAEDNNVWVELPNLVTADEIKKILEAAKYVRENCDVMLVLGVGGSFAGAVAGQMWLSGMQNFSVEYLATSFDPTPLQKAIDKYKGKRICVNIVSKSGTTLEIMTALNALEPHATHMIATTSADRGFLREYAISRGIMCFTILDGVGGRYSAIGACGYLPMAVAGIDISQMHRGAITAYKDLSKPENEAYRYAIARYKLHTGASLRGAKGDAAISNGPAKSVEVFASFYDGLEGLGRWWQQLFGESEGKDGKGLFPVNLVYSRDLHSMGQFMQQGSPIFFETILDVVKSPSDVCLDTKKTDKMTQVPVASMAALNRAAFVGTVKAHADAGVPIVLLRAESLDAAAFGYSLYFFEIACAMSAFLLGVNPFDQPGVEDYKRNMREELKTRG